MRRNSAALLPILLMAGLICTPMAFADEGPDDLKAEINALKNRINQLETKLATVQPAAQIPGGHVGLEAAAPSLEVPSLVRGIGISGYVDTMYTHNFNTPDSITNVGRVFDRTANGFNMNAAEVVIQKPVSADSRAGFRADIFTGNDAEVIGSAGLGLGTNEFEIQQAFVELLVPTGNLASWMNDIDLKAGRYVTMNGAEVIESKDNWNTSRGLLFGYAIPFTHTGIRSTYTFDNGWDICLGVNNGWDVTDDTNNGRTIESHIGLNSIELPWDSSITVGYQYYGGPERAAQDTDWRHLHDIVAILKTPWEPLTLMYNLDYAFEANLIGDNAKGDWWGHAVYARYQFTDKWAASVRAEVLNDEDGVRVVAGTQAEWYEITGTLEYKPWENTITRLELRSDHADKDVFTGNNQVNDNQTSLSSEIMYLF
ncbi:MAG: porin [Candidatus Omnitrophica bacterium]|nr:porin [Candidatus Omnitrophota bacterium]